VTASILNNIFRLNPIFKIALIEDLTEAQKTSFRRVLSGKRVHSLLHAPREANLTVKALNQPLAELLESLRVPTRIADLPARLREESDREMQQLVVQLVLDGVLEVQLNGCYLSGLEALDKMVSLPRRAAHPDQHAERNYTCKISRTAIGFALQSVYKHPRDIAWILYNFNRTPMHRGRLKQSPDMEAVARFLGLDERGGWQGMPETVRPVRSERDDEGNFTPFFQVWRSWKVGRKRGSRDSAGYKVYLSPLPDETPEVFRIVRETVADSGANSMKTGRVFSALLRADKLIVYFRTISGALEYAESLVRATSSFKGQGVPFTYQVAPDNSLISIGVDPPGKFGLDNSWRRYVTDKLALAIQAFHRSTRDDPIAYIRTHMSMFGVDIDQWRPVNNDWTMEFDLDSE
jgi:hypothetical protein